jgi:hypothetical protein
MKLLGVTYKNTEIDDQGTFNALPEVLKKFISQVNGIIGYKGGIHFRGCVKEPLWHSINEVWTGKLAFWKKYPDVLDIDIPFAQDCMGDQYLLRNDKVVRLYGETGELEFMGITFIEFLDAVEKDPLTILGLYPLAQFEAEGNRLQPGMLLQAFPPFCTKSPLESITVKAVPVEEQLIYLADLSRKMRMKRDQEGEDDVNFFVS